MRYFHGYLSTGSDGVGGGVVAEQATETVGGGGDTGVPAVSLPGTGHAEEHYSGRSISWIAVTIVIIGFIVGGVGMVPHPTWWLFWTGAAIVVVGSIITMFAKTFQDDWY
jgi:hypothetical protein